MFCFTGGDAETLDFVAYVAKDATYARACHVLECGGGLAQDVLTTVGQAFELRFKVSIVCIGLYVSVACVRVVSHGILSSFHFHPTGVSSKFPSCDRNSSLRQCKSISGKGWPG